MNWKTWLPLTLALVLGLLAAKVARDVIVRGRSGANSKLVQIAIAKHDLEPGKAIEKGDLAMGTAPEENTPRNAFKKSADLVGRVVLQPIVKDQPILETVLAPVGSGAGPQALVPQGMRAVTLDVNESTGVAGLLMPGCRVDVVSTLQEESGNKRITRTIVENVCVMAVGQRVIGSKHDDEEAARAKTVTLIVTPQQAELIELASNNGRSRLVMRGLLDSSTGSDSAATLAGLLGSYATKPPTAAATTQPANPAPVAVVSNPPAKIEMPVPSRHAVEVISAGKTSVVEFETRKTSGTTALTGDSSGTQQVIPKMP